MKEDQKLQLINPPAELYELLGGALEATVPVTENAEMILFFTNQLEGLESRLLELQESMDRAGMIWVCWYKKASKKPTSLSEDLIRNTALTMDLVDVKVCAVNQDWSGLKLMIRKEGR